MTKVLFKFYKPAPNENVPADGTLNFKPTVKRTATDNSSVTLPVSFTVNVSNGEAVVDLAPTEPGWAWELLGSGFGVSSWREWLFVPEVEEIFYSDLQKVDAATLDPEAEPEAAWWSEIEKLKAEAVQGPPGPQGLPGIDGTNGVDGAPGAPGAKGDKGDPGIQGIQGLKGEDGAPGTNGVDGTPGAKGDKGDPGIQGLKGDAGSNGVDGVDGTNGVDGAPGAPGAKGDKGDPGIQGVQGIQGLKGDTGIQGIQGIQGLKGDTGTAGTSATITGATASALAPGATPTVTPGGTASARTFAFGIPRGADGAAGTITGATATALPAGSNPTVTLGGTASARTFAFGIPRGADGATGATGATGAPGTGGSAGAVKGITQLTTDGRVLPLNSFATSEDVNYTDNDVWSYEDYTDYTNLPVTGSKKKIYSVSQNGMAPTAFIWSERLSNQTAVGGTIMNAMVNTVGGCYVPIFLDDLNSNQTGYNLWWNGARDPNGVEIFTSLFGVAGPATRTSRVIEREVDFMQITPSVFGLSFVPQKSGVYVPSMGQSIPVSTNFFKTFAKLDNGFTNMTMTVDSELFDLLNIPVDEEVYPNTEFLIRF
jgi:hypothetical protein